MRVIYKFNAGLTRNLDTTSIPSLRLLKKELQERERDQFNYDGIFVPPFVTTRTRRQQNSFQFTTLAFDKTHRLG